MSPDRTSRPARSRPPSRRSQRRSAVAACFGRLNPSARRALSDRAARTNLVTACQFCNSTTSRDIAPFTMDDPIADLPDDPDEAVARLAQELQPILESKRRIAQWKLRSVHRAFCDDIGPSLLRRRQEEPRLRTPHEPKVSRPASRGPVAFGRFGLPPSRAGCAAIWLVDWRRARAGPRGRRPAARGTRPPCRRARRRCARRR
jgi:hypothetical protein